MTAAYVGGLVDEVLNLVTNVFLVIPGLPLLIVVSSYLPFRGGLAMTLIIAFTTWAGEARVLRSQALSLRSRDFVLAAKVTGEPLWRIIFGEVMPNMTSRIAAGFLGSFVGAILYEAGLEFLGFGGSQSSSWGVILFWAQNNAALETGSWWHFAFPGLALALTATSLIFINYGIDEISNPRLQKVKMPREPKRRRLQAVVARARQRERTA
jgi:peptide/nickel transport system permease protein